MDPDVWKASKEEFEETGYGKNHGCVQRAFRSVQDEAFSASPDLEVCEAEGNNGGSLFFFLVISVAW